MQTEAAWKILKAAAALTMAALASAAIPGPQARGEDGYELWLRYRLEPDTARRAEYLSCTGAVTLAAQRPMLAAARDELERGLAAIAGAVPGAPGSGPGGVLIGTPSDSP